jgi:hypothetical protein
MGDECANAVSNLTAVQTSSYAAYKQAIQQKFLTEHSKSHIMTLLRQCVMRSDETTKQYIARLWALVIRLPNYPDEWRECEVLTCLRTNHADEKICHLLLEKDPKTVAEAERLCEAYQARTEVAPISTKVVAAMAAASAAHAGPSQAVDNIGASGGYRGPKARGRGGRGQPRGNRGGNSQPPSACFRCGQPGHIARYCTAPSSVVQRVQQGRGRPAFSRSFSRGNHRSVANVNSEPGYADYGANEEQRQFDSPWNPSHLPVKR